MGALRTDMDALPIVEDNDIEFICDSNGLMHARSHDEHIAVCPGTAKMISGMKEDIQGEVFLFRHTEELYPSMVVSEAGERA